MPHEHISTKRGKSETSFRWRGGEISRIEGFSDAVFAFAVTLLVVSLEVPETFTALWEKMHGFVAFTICFAMLFSVWYDQHIFFRRYALKDTLTTWLNGALLFVVLFYVYPLKFLFTMLVKVFTGASLQVKLPNGATESMIDKSQLPLLMIIYGLGFIAVSIIFVALYDHAYRRRANLDLNELEELDTRSSMQSHLLNIGVGVLSMAIIGFDGSAAWAGIIYWLIAPLQAGNGVIMGRRRRKLEKRFEAASTN